MSADETRLLDIDDLDDDDRLHILSGLAIWCDETHKHAKAVGDKSGLRQEQGALDGLVDGIQEELIAPGPAKLRIRVNHLTAVTKGLEALYKRMLKTIEDLKEEGEPELSGRLAGRAEIVKGRLLPYFDMQTHLPLDNNDPWEDETS